MNDVHLWANTYDRKLNDILGVESEIAKGIVVGFGVDSYLLALRAAMSISML